MYFSTAIVSRLNTGAEFARLLMRRFTASCLAFRRWCAVAKAAPKNPRGRPALPPDEAQTAMIRERVTEEQRREYEARGGKAWLVAALNRKRK